MDVFSQTLRFLWYKLEHFTFAFHLVIILLLLAIAFALHIALVASALFPLLLTI
jgi:hypothetical protein